MKEQLFQGKKIQEFVGADPVPGPVMDLDHWCTLCFSLKTSALAPSFVDLKAAPQRKPWKRLLLRGCVLSPFML